jgi:hypothetical protein
MYHFVPRPEKVYSGHTREVQGLYSLAAAFEDVAACRNHSTRLTASLAKVTI